MTLKKLKDLLEYREGGLYWKRRMSPKALIGDRAGFRKSNGYRYVVIEGRHYLEHRLVFLYNYGYLPKYIDHIDGDKENNEITNLRACTSCQNNYNRKIRSDNTSGVKGVSWYKPYNKWVCKIWVDKKPIFLGYYEDLELAELVVHEARLHYHRDFANLTN